MLTRTGLRPEPVDASQRLQILPSTGSISSESADGEHYTKTNELKLRIDKVT